MSSPADLKIIKMLENSPKGRLMYETGWDKAPHSTLLLVSNIQSETDDQKHRIIERAIRLSRKSLNETPKRPSFSNDLISPRSNTKTKVRSFTFETQEPQFERTKNSTSEGEDEPKSTEKRGYGILDDDKFDIIGEAVAMNLNSPVYDNAQTLLREYNRKRVVKDKIKVENIKDEFDQHEWEFTEILKSKYEAIEKKYNEKYKEIRKEVEIREKEFDLLEQRCKEEGEREILRKNQILSEIKEKEKAKVAAAQIQQKEFEAQKAIQAQKEKERQLETEEAKRKAEEAKSHAEALKLQEEAEKKKLKEEDDKKSAAAKQSISSQEVPIEFKGCIFKGDLDKYLKSQHILENVKRDVQHISAQDPQTKQFYFLASKSVNTPLNSLSAEQGIGAKLNHLIKLLQGESVLVDEKPFSHTMMQKGDLFINNLLANRFVKKSEAEITKGGNFILPLATLGVSLVTKFPTLGILIQSAFYKHCPFLVPFNYPRNNLSVEQYAATIGHDIKGGESAVTQTLIERLSGYCILYGMMVKQIIENKTKMTGGAANFFTLEEVWRIIAVILKLQPQLDVTATVLQSLLDTVGDRLEETYRKQFWKIMQFIVSQFVGKIRGITPPNKVGAISRFEIFLEAKMKSGFRKTNFF